MKPVRISVELGSGRASDHTTHVRFANDNPSREQELFERSIRRELVDDTA